ncbi:GntR family transcriptional regulator [Actinomadura sp. WAC 06369]|uniref:GntR family transcriptional regulator n=1 Tax=Actinomadura sp. WAC 06369 TaxID=2203193 RepID=UPI000F789C02|nr:GntR family transcriptional regulator [Actinomadura sp. WAC 06369]RSN50734.1 GntR family transcriptional regulator [Actinomadura sp. WAC 06369]
MPDRPAYLRIADTLREGIRDGSLPPGSRLPTMAQLRRAHGVSEIVARQAIGVLRGEGLVETRRGGGTVVRIRPPVRRVAMDRYRAVAPVAPAGPPAGPSADPDEQDAAPQTTFTRDQKISWEEYRLDKEFTRVRADPELGALFELPPGTELLRRRFVFYARDEPQQISVNFLPWALVGDTPVADPAREPWPGGTLAQLAYLGHPPTRVEESVRSRMPTPDEVETLRLTGGVPVLAITRRLLSGPGVMEVCRDIVLPADRVVLDYAIDL